MPQDAFVQVAPDSSGKKISMDQTVDSAGNTVLVQRALLVGEAADALSQILETQRIIAATLRAILQVLSDSSNSTTTEEDFSGAFGGKFDG